MSENTAPTPAPTYSGQDLADLIGVQGIQLRRYIRSDGTRVGRGRTYKFTAEESLAILTGFAGTRQKEELTDAQKEELAQLFAAPAEEGSEEGSTEGE